MTIYLKDKLLIIVLTLAILTNSSCDSSSSKNNSIQKAADKTATASLSGSTPLPSDQGIQKEMVERIVEECTHTDFTFYDKPVSMNQAGKEAILSDLGYISIEAIAEIPAGCKPEMRKVFWGKAGVIIEADLYIGEGCNLVVFIKDEKPLYGNRLTQQGISAYLLVLDKVNTTSKM